DFLAGIRVQHIETGIIETTIRFDNGTCRQKYRLSQAVNHLPVMLEIGDAQQVLLAPIREGGTEIDAPPAIVHVRSKAVQIGIRWNHRTGTDRIVLHTWRDDKLAIHDSGPAETAGRFPIMKIQADTGLVGYRLADRCVVKLDHE